MNEAKKIQSEIRKEIKTVHNRIIYKAYENMPLIKDCKSDFIKANFSEWNEVKFALGGIFNLSKFYYTIDDIKSQLKEASKKFSFNVSYWNENEDYYCEKIYCETFLDECIISVMSSDKVKYFLEQGREKSDFIAISRLKEYEIDHPNQKVWAVDCWNDLPKKITKKMIKENLIIKPSKKFEWFMF